MGHKYTKILPVEDGDQCEAALYLGSIDYVVEDEILAQFRITAIVSVLPNQPAHIDAVLQKHKIPLEDYFVYPLEDNADEYISLFDNPGVMRTLEFIHSRRLQGKSVLVHCDAGITRSPAVIVAYLMKYGMALSQPRATSLRDSLALVRQLRERVDVCVFQADLVELENVLFGDTVQQNLQHPPGGYYEGIVPPIPTAAVEAHTPGVSSCTAALFPTHSDVTITSPASYPRTPHTPMGWDEVRLEGEVSVDLELLQRTWLNIQSMEGGQVQFGINFYKNMLAMGTPRMKEMFGRVDPAGLSGMMTRMMHQVIWGMTSRNLQKLVHFHRHLTLLPEDFDHFREAMVATIAQALSSEPPETVQEWDTFFRVLFRRWLTRLERGTPSTNSPAISAAFPGTPMALTPTLQLA
eukprot:RCo042728